MGRYYRVFAEAKVKEKWVNLNPYIVDLGGKVKLAFTHKIAVIFLCLLLLCPLRLYQTIPLFLNQSY